MLQFEVNGQTLTRKDQFKPATDSVEYLKAKFTFNTNEWSNTTKTALFRNGDKSYPAVLDGSGACIIPWEALVDNDNYRFAVTDNYIYVSVFGVKGSTRITSNELKIMIDRSGYTEGETPSDPTPDAYAQYVELVKAEADKIAQVGEEVATAHNDIKNSYANSFKGEASGEVVRVDDVSPVEHTLKVKATGKNLFNVSKFEITDAVNNDYPYVTDVGNDYIDITVEETYDGNGHIAFTLKLKDVCPQIVPGRTYFLSGISNAWNKCIYLKQLDYFWNFGNPLTVTDEMLECTLGLYGYATYRGQDAGTCRISNIQIEEGNVATEYTPYIDPTTVKITRCGKNLLPYPYDSTHYDNGITFTDNGDGSITLNGTNNGESNSVFYLTKDNYIPLLKGSYVGATMPTGINIMAVEKGGGYLTLNKAFVRNESTSLRSVYIQVAKGNTTTFNNVKVYPMLEVGAVVSDYETSKVLTYIPNADGSVAITSVSPTMTLLTDTDGVTIDLEYNRDTTAVVGDIESALDSIIAMQKKVIGGESV